MSDEIYLTAEGAVKLRKELEHLKGEERPKLSQRLREAVSMGDLSENADYHAAKEYQGFLEGRIQELEHLLQEAVIVERSTGIKDVVAVGATVTIQEEGFPQETYQVVGAKEADPANGRISNESPIGSALLDKRVGDEVVVQTPEGQLRLKIIKIK
jgi:transcription elongation factor GreA